MDHVPHIIKTIASNKEGKYPIVISDISIPLGRLIGGE